MAAAEPEGIFQLVELLARRLVAAGRLSDGGQIWIGREAELFGEIDAFLRQNAVE